MKRLFISHCAKDSRAVFEFIKLLKLGMSISDTDIFCTSVSGTLPAGENFSDNIRNALRQSQVVLCFITPSFLESKYCISELGASWAENKKLIPLTVPPAIYKDLNDTPLQGIQTLKQNSAEDLTVLYDTLCELGIAQRSSAPEFYRQLNLYLEKNGRRAR